MPDPVNASAAVVLAAGAKQLLGPAAHEIGQALGRSAESRLRNFGKITAKAERKAGAQLEQPGEVPLRVAARVADQGSWCDDDVMQEYLAGILVGSRSPDGRDDQGTYWVDLVARMATVHVRMHYLIYRALRDNGRLGDPSLGLIEGQRSRSVYIPFAGLTDGLEVDEAEAEQQAHAAIPVLAREQLVGAEWGVGTPVLERFPGATKRGLHVMPTHAGIDLYLWAHGRPATNSDVIVNPAYELPDFAEHLASPVGALIGPMG